MFEFWLYHLLARSEQGTNFSTVSSYVIWNINSTYLAELVNGLNEKMKLILPTVPGIAQVSDKPRLLLLLLAFPLTIASICVPHKLGCVHLEGGVFLTGALYQWQTFYCNSLLLKLPKSSYFSFWYLWNQLFFSSRKAAWQKSKLNTKQSSHKCINELSL